MKRNLILEKKNVFFICEAPNLKDYIFFSQSVEFRKIGIMRDKTERFENSTISTSRASHLTSGFIRNGKIFAKLNILDTPDGRHLKILLKNNIDFNFFINYNKKDSILYSIDIII
jgi:hypothetical protein